MQRNRKMRKSPFGLQDRRPVLLFPPPVVPSAIVFSFTCMSGNKTSCWLLHPSQRTWNSSLTTLQMSEMYTRDYDFCLTCSVERKPEPWIQITWILLRWKWFNFSICVKEHMFGEVLCTALFLCIFSKPWNDKNQDIQVHPHTTGHMIRHEKRQETQPTVIRLKEVN